MAPLQGCVIIAQQWTHVKSNSTLTDFVIKEAENACEPSQGPRSTLFHPSNHKSLVLSSQNHKIQLVFQTLHQQTPPLILSFNSEMKQHIFRFVERIKKTCPRVTMQSNSK